jgi:hypothetical protein
VAAQPSDAIKIAKDYVNEVFADEHVTNLGLDETEYDPATGRWYITVGFSRPWNTPRTKARELLELTNAVGTFTTRCIDGLEARPEQCARHIEAGVSTVTALVPLPGYERAAALAKQALAEGRTVRELALLTGQLTAARLDEVLYPAKLAG